MECPQGDGRPPAGDACPPSNGYGPGTNGHDPGRALLDHDPDRRLEVQVVDRCLDLAAKVAALELRERTDDDVRDVLAAITGTTRGKSIDVIRGASTPWLETTLASADKFEADLTGGDEPPDEGRGR